MNNTELYENLLERARTYCSRQEVCRSDMENKLQQWKAEEEFIPRILKTLEEEHFVDNGRYARSYARDKIRFNKWGKGKIRYMLRQKQISDEHISGALEEIPAEEYESMVMEELQRKRKGIKAKNRYDLLGKLQRFAYQRGYENDFVHQVLDE